MVRRMSWRLVAALVAGGWASAAAANGGGGSTVYLGGGVTSIVPLHDKVIRLVREDLDIVVGEQEGRLQDPIHWSYRVHARYRLANPGPAKTVLYTVPIILPEVPPDDGGPDEVFASSHATKVAESTRITLDGVAHECRYQALPPPFARTERWAELGRSLSTSGLTVSGFCLVSLDIRSGKDIDLALEYSGDLFGLDVTEKAPKECDAVPFCEEGENAKACARRKREHERWAKANCDPPTVHSGPWFYYALGAASSWAGTPDVSVTVHLGGFGVNLSSSSNVPAEATVRGKTLRWTWKRQSLEGLDFSVALEVPGRWNRSLAAFNGGAGDPEWCRPQKITARASSSLAAQQGNAYGPDQVLDGRGATAWCVNTPRDGVGEWIELEFEPGPSYASSAGLFVVPGYAKSQASFEANAQVEAVRYGPCGKDQQLVEARLPLEPELFDAAVEVPDSAKALGDLLEKAREGKACLHVEIARTRPGKKFKDVCISEIVAPLRCR